MFAKERQDLIAEMLRKDGAVTVSDLAERFAVSAETVRRDLLYLEQIGVVQRVHGGAVMPGAIMSVSKLPERIEENKTGKIQVSEAAADLVQEHDTIYIDNGATAVYLAHALKARFSHLCVVTNSQDVFNILCDKEGFELILTGGRFMREERAFYGYLTLEAIKKIHVDKAFIVPSAISLQGGICDFNHELTAIQHQIASQCGRAYYLADSDKFERHGLLKLRDLEAGCFIVTDCALREDLRRLYEEKNIHIITKKESIL